MNRDQILASLHENNPAGSKLVELSKEELERVYGGADMNIMSTPACTIVITITITSL
ncbi:mersacidin family lantibiotic [Paenibacillus sp. SC116]|uniref:mersacidin family lantibiotic n=1 Tax=Paenibacillus sp. SC116 TaxID=2968986 RepID=UPI00215AB73C|nr:mersacidin family lantibiotic [Paenibacillus sp. SC116]MCR8842732.1 mersacidin family lantibiotic [Paenibacillus sp. SC116]